MPIYGSHVLHLPYMGIYWHTKTPIFSAPERFFILIFAIPPLFRTRNTVKDCITSYDQYFWLCVKMSIFKVISIGKHRLKWKRLDGTQKIKIFQKYFLCFLVTCMGILKKISKVIVKKNANRAQSILRCQGQWE